jgi:putative endonuclease
MTPHDYTDLFLQAALAQKKAITKRKQADWARRSSSAQQPHKSLPSSNRSPLQRRGDAYESLAQHHLQRAGCVVLSRQLHCPAGELDLVVREGGELVFVEVRQRTSARFGGAAASVTPDKQRRILRAARWFLNTLVQQHFDGITPYCRIDVLAFEPEGLIWHRDAFRLTLDQ